MLDGLPLAWLGALSDGAGNEDDELAGGAALEVAEVADVRRVREHHRLRARLAAGRGAPGSGGRRLQHQERRNLHPFDAVIRAHTTSWLRRDGWMDGWTEIAAEKEHEASAPFLVCWIRSHPTTCTAREQDDSPRR